MTERSVIRPLGNIVVGSALQILASQERTSVDRLRHRLRAGESSAHSRLRVAIARQLRLIVRSDVGIVRDLHLFGSSLHDQARPTSDLDLIVHLRQRHAEVEAQLRALAAEVSAAYRALIDSVPSDFELISFQFVTDLQVQDRKGFAALIGSLHTPSLRLDE